ncbi:hypothetical protein HMN09_01087300 [Mycena chlorophos]|uniref:Transmembrane protein n=1 Tax=Mycena chlorophos TaxID=658473 RepID=A0A8H6SD98_MYCCL|nr:hypothetical protein HMN09_01087300 [Mycena chlorophos]
MEDAEDPESGDSVSALRRDILGSAEGDAIRGLVDLTLEGLAATTNDTGSDEGTPFSSGVTAAAIVVGASLLLLLVLILTEAGFRLISRMQKRRRRRHRRRDSGRRGSRSSRATRARPESLIKKRSSRRRPFAAVVEPPVPTLPTVGEPPAYPTEGGWADARDAEWQATPTPNAGLFGPRSEDGEGETSRSRGQQPMPVIVTGPPPAAPDLYITPPAAARPSGDFRARDRHKGPHYRRRQMSRSPSPPVPPDLDPTLWPQTPGDLGSSVAPSGTESPMQQRSLLPTTSRGRYPPHPPPAASRHRRLPASFLSESSVFPSGPASGAASFHQERLGNQPIPREFAQAAGGTGAGHTRQISVSRKAVPLVATPQRELPALPVQEVQIRTNDGDPANGK